MYDSLHSAAISVYLSCCRHPEEKDLLFLWHENRKSLIALLQEVCFTLINKSQGYKIYYMLSSNEHEVKDCLRL